MPPPGVGRGVYRLAHGVQRRAGSTETPLPLYYEVPALEPTLTLQDQLSTLFEKDSNVRALRRRLDAATRRRDAQQEKLVQLQEQHGERSTELKKAKAHAATLEGEASDSEARVKKLREQLQNTSDQKAYSALSVEVNNLKIQQGKLESQALDQLGRIETLDRDAEKSSTKVDEQEKLVADAGSEIEAATAEVGDRLAEVEADRDKAAEDVPAETRKIYDRLQEDTEGEAVCGIEEQDRKRMEYTCGGCYMTLPVQAVNATMSRPEELTFCPSCGRILVADTTMKEELAAR